MRSASSVPTPGSGTRALVLVVDDEQDIRFLVRMTLSFDGYEVVEAGHGGEALERIRESRPDLIVTDLMMPIMSGRALMDHLRADPETADIPIIQISAHTGVERTAADAALIKPFRPDELLEAARRLMEVPQSAR